MNVLRTTLTGLVTLATLVTHAAALDPIHIRDAADYSARQRGSALLVVQGGRELYAAAQGSFELTRPHLLASGSKSFSCAIAVALADDGRLDLDERASDTLTEWRTDVRKRDITVRQLLSFTSGLPARVGPAAVRLNEDLYGAALRAPAEAAPGARYTYGNSHLAAFGELVRRKTGQDPAQYLQRRVLDPIGARAVWQRDRVGNPNLAGSAGMTARDWARYGQLVLQQGRWKGRTVLSAERLRQCFEGSGTLAAYGLTWWLNVPFAGTLDADDEVPVRALGGADGATRLAPSAPTDVAFAAGAGNQRLYLIPSENAVVVRFGEGGPWSDEEFLARLLGRVPTSVTPPTPDEVAASDPGRLPALQRALARLDLNFQAKRDLLAALREAGTNRDARSRALRRYLTPEQLRDLTTFLRKER
ncbi:serine hydrolase domain-containing protein [Deinococcus pimensis]|uniref:serine hydrolase domain-containing protein n=1 Tax=Deinococcus pimensis TaxID=309888 RepID=UPI000694EF56|nr:serine hydrolase [Deinococcus pimensis]